MGDRQMERNVERQIKRWIQQEIDELTYLKRNLNFDEPKVGWKTDKWREKKIDKEMGTKRQMDKQTYLEKY